MIKIKIISEFNFKVDKYKQFSLGGEEEWTQHQEKSQEGGL